MLTVDFKKEIGIVIAESREGNPIALPIYQCNGLYAVCQCREEDGEKVYDLVSFALSETHLKNMLGLTRDFKNCTLDWMLGVKMDFRYKESQTIGKIFLQAMAKGKWKGMLSTLD